MDYKISEMDLSKRGIDVELVSGLEAKKQIIYVRLVTEKGSFIYDETLGSRLRLLLREKPSKWKSMGELYVREALAPEKNLEILDVEVQVLNKTQINIIVHFKWDEIRDKIEVII